MAATTSTAAFGINLDAERSLNARARDLLERLEHPILFRTGLGLLAIEARWSVRHGGDGYDPADTGRIANAAYQTVDFGARSGRKYLTIEGSVTLGDVKQPMP